MPYIILFLFVTAILLAFLEDRMQGKLRNCIYIFFLIALVLTAGLKEIGIDPDSENYEFTYRNYYTTTSSDNTEFTFLALSAFFNLFTNDVHLLLLTYALMGVGLKMLALRKYTEELFLSLAVYISFYYCVHEITQIRTGVLSGFFLLALIAIAEKKRMLALIFISLGSCFHVSGLVLIPLLFINNKELKGKRQILWNCAIPMGYLVYFIGVGILMVFDIPFIGTKLANYQSANETGISEAGVNVFGPLYLMNILIFYYLMYFSKTITAKVHLFPIVMKSFAISMFSYAALAFLPVVAERISLLIRVVVIVAFPCIAYTIVPRWVGILIVMALGIIYLNYGLNYIDFQLLWKV